MSNTENQQPVYRQLPCPLTEDELRQRSEWLVAELARVNRLSDEKKAQASALGEQIKEAQAAVDKLANEIRTKSAEKPVECEWRFEYGRGVADLRRLDTNEIVSTRPLTEAELNRKLPLEEDDVVQLRRAK